MRRGSRAARAGLLGGEETMTTSGNRAAPGSRVASTPGRWWRGRALLAASCAIAWLAIACQQPARSAAPAQQPTDITFRFSFLDLGYNAPFYLAEERGYYRDAGLNVTFQEGRGGDTTLKLIANGSNDLGMSDA